VAYTEHRVEGPLGQWIECAWTREGPDGYERIVPDGCMDLIWSEGAGLRVVGPNTTAFMAPMREGGSVLGVRLHPGAAPPVFGVSAPALLDARLPAQTLWGDTAKRLDELLGDEETAAGRANLLIAFLSQRATAPPDPLVRAAARRLESARVADVASELAVSERHLRRLVSANVGYGPKLLGRVLRLRRALGRVRAGAELAEVAFEAGYADQAHFSQDCRALAGVPPGRFLQDAAAAPRDDAGMTEKARLGWVIVYVSDVRAAIEFYETAFALERTFVADDGSFGELDTGETRLAFASEAQGESNFDGGYERPGDRPFNVEIALVFDDPAAAFRRAVENGASAHAEPVEKPWGQVVAYIRDPFGTLVELASPTD
jgi:AraC-like DNA-binding protein